MRAANYGPIYAAGLYPALAEVFREHGYALAVHGSVGTDFDLIAVPWTEKAEDPEYVLSVVMQRFQIRSITDGEPDGTRAHGRRAFKLHMSFGNCALDISFTPRRGFNYEAQA